MLENPLGIGDPRTDSDKLRAIQSAITGGPDVMFARLSLPEERTDAATRTFVYDEQGACTDVIFTSNGNQATLKSVLPGSYTLFIDGAFNAFAHYDPKSDTVSMPDESRYDSSGEYNLHFLHESGHALDFALNHERYDQLMLYAVIADRQSSIFARISDAIHKGRNWRLEAEMIKDDLIDDLLFGDSVSLGSELVVPVLEKMVQSLPPDISEEDALKYMSMYNWRSLKMQAKRTSLVERNAAAVSLYALIAFQEKGIPLFFGSKADLWNQLNRSLSGYNEKYYFTTDKYPFLLKPHDSQQGDGA